MSMRKMGRLLWSEVDKARTSPAVLLLLAAMPILAAACAAALVTWADNRATTTPTAVALQLVVFCQAGVVVLGHLLVSQEYQGSVVTSLLATPQRPRLAAAQGAVAAALGLLAGLASVGAAWLTAAALSHRWGMDQSQTRHLAGAVATLVALTVLSWGITLAMRGSVSALIAVLALIFVVSPVLAIATEHVRWLPDRLGARLYAGGDPKVSVSLAVALLALWAVVPAVAGAARFARHDA